jgi:hypothetical protein
MPAKRTKSASQPICLVCPKCGNDERFIEIMKEEAHLVDSKLTYITLVEGIPDSYVCVKCHETIPADFLD